MYRIVTGLISLLIFFIGKEIKGQIDYENHIRAGIMNNEANQKINSGNPQEALNMLTSAVKLDSTIREIYINIANAGNLVKNYDLIEKYMVYAKSIFLEDDEICYYLGNAYQNQNKNEKAIKEYSLAIEYSKKNGEDFPLVYAYYFNRANCYLKQDKSDLALQDYDYSLKFKPENENAYGNRGVAHLKLKKKQEACDDWKKALDLGLTSAKNYLEKYCK